MQNAPAHPITIYDSATNGWIQMFVERDRGNETQSMECMNEMKRVKRHASQHVMRCEQIKRIARALIALQAHSIDLHSTEHTQLIHCAGQR